MDRAERAVTLKHGGCNCCQAVLLACADQTGLDEETLKQLGAGFGVGMGNMSATCGALCASQMLLGLKQYEGRPLLRDARALAEAFERQAGAVTCADLKGRDTGRPLTDCDDCVRLAVRLAEEQAGV